MSAVACEVIGTGDGEIKNPSKNEGTASKTIAKDLILEIIDNALELVDDTSKVTVKNIMDHIPVEDCKEKHLEECSTTKEKSGGPLIGTGDQRSNVNLETHEAVPYHPPVEKKNRLTDLVKNSKQILAKIMMSDSKLLLQEEKREEEKIVEVIELDCVQISDLPFKSRTKVLPEEVPIPDNDSQDLLNPCAEESMEEIGLNTEGTSKETAKKIMTFPRASGSKARMAFAAKCRTLKMGATNLKKKKWDVSGKIANFFRKKRGSKDEKKSPNASEKAKKNDGFNETKESAKE